MEGSFPHPSLKGPGEGRGAYSVLLFAVSKWYVFPRYTLYINNNNNNNNNASVILVENAEGAPSTASDAKEVPLAQVDGEQTEPSGKGAVDCI